MKISESTDYQTTSIIKSTVKVSVNGLLMSKAGIGDESSTPLSIYEYIADDTIFYCELLLLSVFILPM